MDGRSRGSFRCGYCSRTGHRRQTCPDLIGPRSEWTAQQRYRERRHARGLNPRCGCRVKDCGCRTRHNRLRRERAKQRKVAA